MAWEHILSPPRRLGRVLTVNLLPMMLLAAVAEGFGMVTWGKHQSFLRLIHKFSVGEAVIYEAARLVMGLAIVVVCAVVIKVFAETFGKRHPYRQTFTLVAFGLSPLFLFRLLDAFPWVSPWLTWLVGVALCTEVLYQGVPRVLDPDPPNAFGLYFMSSLVLAATTGLERFVTAWFLSGRMRSVNDILTSLLDSLHRHLPF